MGLTSENKIGDLFVKLTDEAQESLQIGCDALKDKPGLTLDSIKDARETIDVLENIAMTIAFGGEYDG